MQILKGVTWFSALVLFRERLIASNNNEKKKYRTKKETLRQGLMQRHILLRSTNSNLRFLDQRS